VALSHFHGVTMNNLG